MSPNSTGREGRVPPGRLGLAGAQSSWQTAQGEVRAGSDEAAIQAEEKGQVLAVPPLLAGSI